jgi:hypothetical protein
MKRTARMQDAKRMISLSGGQNLVKHHKAAHVSYIDHVVGDDDDDGGGDDGCSGGDAGAGE